MDKVLLPGVNNNDGLNPIEKPGSQGAIHFALLANSNNINEIYVGGDRQDASFPNAIGATNYNGAIWRGDSTVTATGANPSPQWEHMTHKNNIASIAGGGTASNSAPHADCRDMASRADGRLMEGSDGGITVRTSPSSNAGDWYSVCGTMDVFEAHNIAYEPVRRTVLFGTQDNANVLGRLGSPNTYQVVSSGDGSDVMIDWKSDAELIFYYFGSQRFGTFRRLAINKVTGITVTSDSVTLFTGAGTAAFVPVTAMNPNDQKQFVVAVRPSGTSYYNHIVFTTNRGSTSWRLYNIAVSSDIEAFAWTADGAILYAVFGPGQFASCSNAGGSLACSLRANIPSPFVRHLAVNPTNPSNVFAAAVRGRYDFLNPRAFHTIDGCASWTEITVAGSLLDAASVGGAVVFIQKGTFGTVAYGTSNGVLIPDGALGVGWKSLSPGLPKVVIMDMVYDETDDRLVISTLGRGVWYLEYASLIAQGIQPSGMGEPGFTQGTNSNLHDDVDYVEPYMNNSPLVPPDDYQVQAN